MPGQGAPLLAIVLPCYNEEAIIDTRSFIVFVDDGSRDNTWSLIEKLHQENPGIYTGIKLSTNFGHQGALLAGLFSVEPKVDCAVTIDADLQDDHRVIEQMVRKFSEGAEVVYGVRSSRLRDSFYTRVTAEIVYKLMLKMRVKTIYNHADFRLISRRVI